MENLLSHIYFICLKLRKRLSRSQKAIAAWQKTILHSPSLPLNHHFLLTLMFRTTDKKHMYTTVALVVAWGGYLRGSESFEIRR